jgi:hypothetical protein
MSWSPAGKLQRGQPQVKWEKEVERLMKKRNFASEDAKNGKV